MITLAVNDLQRALHFYGDGLGLETPGIVWTEFTGDDTIPAGSAGQFQLRDGLILALYPRAELAKDASAPLAAPKTGEFSIGHAVATRADVDALLAKAKGAGARVTGVAHDRAWGIYSGYFQGS